MPNLKWSAYLIPYLFFLCYWVIIDVSKGGLYLFCPAYQTLHTIIGANKIAPSVFISWWIRGIFLREVTIRENKNSRKNLEWAIRENLNSRKFGPIQYFKPNINQYIYQEWQNEWNNRIHNKLHEIQSEVGKTPAYMRKQETWFNHTAIKNRPYLYNTWISIERWTSTWMYTM